MNVENKNLLVVVAHPGDFVWRSAGAIAAHLAAGWNVEVVCCSLGSKGEAGALWKQPGATLESVAAIRLEEAHRAADVLGVQLHMLGLADYPLVLETKDTLALAQRMRSFRPAIVLTHPPVDPGNADHVNVSACVMQARVLATAPGYGADTITPPNVYYFEPHQPEQSDFKADLFLDITPVWSIKRRTFEAIASQKGVWDYYERVALQRGAQAGRRSTRPIQYAEAYSRAFPSVTELFSE
ncbi:4-oxalmesaconate hydratase [Pseudomonas fluorescens]|uniref:4-oxalmesaconate hydratase n=1 Tax=Pseudomonas fluorescens TaxID=294 RepID=A0A5E6TGL4_PSEFL|nr:PIG-L deacetylase family protein [Pseudomonas fluorescens]VVM92356.1 4-oxalmesaconate hydratase [Pseudomonas fluorescens]VVO97664.1 4-oxalmesaconate hydratase [Pseudomonas fluorescens]